MGCELDAVVGPFRERRLDHVAFPYVFLDATYVKAHAGASVVSKAIVIATGVTAKGDREVLGLAVGDSEDGAFWTAFLRSLRSRGLSGVHLVISDAHEGLKGAIASVLLGSAWQRCKVHFLRNVLSRIPKGSAEMVLAAIRTVFAQPDAASAREQLDEIVEKLTPRFPVAAEMLAMLTATRSTIGRHPRRASSGMDEPPAATYRQGWLAWAMARVDHQPPLPRGDPGKGCLGIPSKAPSRSYPTEAATNGAAVTTRAVPTAGATASSTSTTSSAVAPAPKAAATAASMAADPASIAMSAPRMTSRRVRSSSTCAMSSTSPGRRTPTYSPIIAATKASSCSERRRSVSS